MSNLQSVIVVDDAQCNLRLYMYAPIRAYDFVFGVLNVISYTPVDYSTELKLTRFAPLRSNILSNCRQNEVNISKIEAGISLMEYTGM